MTIVPSSVARSFARHRQGVRARHAVIATFVAALVVAYLYPPPAGGAHRMPAGFASAAKPTGTPRTSCSSKNPFTPPVMATLAFTASTPGVLALDERRGLAVVVSSTSAARSTIIDAATFDVATGKVVRSRRVTTGAGPRGGQDVLSYTTSLAVDGMTGRVFVLHQPYAQGVSPPGRVDVLDERTLAPLRSVTVGRMALAPVVDEPTGRVFIANQQSGTMSVLDAATGRLSRTVRLSGAALASSAPPVVDVNSGRVFFAEDARPGAADVLDARSGALVRRVSMGGAPRAIAIDRGKNRVIVSSGGTGAGSVSVLDARTGNVLHTTTVPGTPALNALVISQTTHRAFVSYDDTVRVSMLDTGTGRIRHTLPVRYDFESLGMRIPVNEPTSQPGEEAPPVVSRVDELRRWVIVGVPPITDDDGASEPYSGQIAVLDSRTGMRIHTVPEQRVWPEAAAVDNRRGRAFVYVADGIDVYDVSCLKSYYVFGDIG